MKVLYIHGLESGPTGRKSVALAEAGFEVAAEKMPCGRNDVLADPWVRLTGVAALVWGLFAVLAFGAPGLVAVVLLLAVASVLAKPFLMRRVWERSIAVQVAAIATHHPDVIVGSSFGGAVALELQVRKIWQGRTVLLCPAHQLVAQRANVRGAPSRIPPVVEGRTVVVHGRQDETVPFQHSEALVQSTAAKFIAVDDDHRLSINSTAANLKQWVELSADSTDATGSSAP